MDHQEEAKPRETSRSCKCARVSEHHAMTGFKSCFQLLLQVGIPGNCNATVTDARLLALALRKSSPCDKPLKCLQSAEQEPYTLKSLTGLEMFSAKASRNAAARSPSTILSSALRVTVMEGVAMGWPSTRPTCCCVPPMAKIPACTSPCTTLACADPPCTGVTAYMHRLDSMDS